jgi:hypothetical protein
MPDMARDPIPTVLMNFRLDIPLLSIDLIFIESPPFCWTISFSPRKEIVGWLVILCHIIGPKYFIELQKAVNLIEKMS